MSPKQPKPMTGEQLDRAIVQLGCNQSSFARALQLDPRSIRKYISGERPLPPHIAMLVNLMLATGTKPEELRP